MNILFAPHNDDETLFAAFTLMRKKPLVVICTDSYIQEVRGDNITAEQRREETREAMKILGCEVVFLGLKDTELNIANLADAVHSLIKKDKDFFLDFVQKGHRVYAPAVQGGNVQHDLVGDVIEYLFYKVIHYTTYTKTELYTTGTTEIVPTEEEKALKIKALGCYKSQLNLPSTRPHFAAVLDKSEWYA